MHPHDQVRRVGLLTALVSLAVYLMTTGGSMATDIMTYEVTKNMVEHRSVAMSYNVFQMDAHRGVDGRYYAPYGIGHALYSIPFYMAGRTAERLIGLQVGKAEVLRKAGLVLGSAFAVAGCVWLAFWFAVRLFGDVGAAVKTALTLGFATLLWPYSKFGFNAPLATLCLLAGMYGTWVGVRMGRPWALVGGGLGLGSALLVRHELALALGPLAVWVMLESGRDWRRLLGRATAIGGPVLAAGLLTAYYNYLRFGNPLDPGYLRDQTAGFGSLWVGLAGLSASPGASLFLYSPVLLLGVVALRQFGRLDRRTAMLFGGQALILFLFYAALRHWDAERSYGPRYLLPILPYLCIPLGLWWQQAGTRRRLLTTAVAFSALIQLPGVCVDFSKVGFTPAVGDRSWEQRRWEWSSSSLALSAEAAARAIPRNVRHLTRRQPRPDVRPAAGLGQDFSAQFAFSLDFWWMYLFYLGAIPAFAAVGLGLLPLSVACLGAWRLREQLRAAGGFGMRPARAG